MYYSSIEMYKYQEKFSASYFRHIQKMREKHKPIIDYNPDIDIWKQIKEAIVTKSRFIYKNISFEHKCILKSIQHVHEIDTYLKIIFASKDYETLRRFIELIYDVKISKHYNNSCIAWTIHQNREDIFTRLINLFKKYPHFTEYINLKDKHCSTPLVYAVRLNKKIFIDELLKFGCDINTINQQGYTVLTLAIKKNYIHTVNKLVQQNSIDFTIKNRKFYTPLIVTIKHKNSRLKIIKILIKYGYNITNEINIVPQIYQKYLLYSRRKKKMKSHDNMTIRYLVNHGIKLNSTELVDECYYYQNISRIKFFIEAGCNLKFASRHKKTYKFYLKKHQKYKLYEEEINKSIKRRSTLLIQTLNFIRRNRKKFTNLRNILNRDLRKLIDL